MKLRRLTPEGVEQFGRYLAQLKEAPKTPPPSWLLTDAVASEPVADIEIEDRSFATRYDAAMYLDKVLSHDTLVHVDRDAELWAWLSLRFFDQVCPLESGGIRKPYHRSRHIPEISSYKRYYRHLLLGPYVILQAHRDDPARVRGVLMNEVHKPGDVTEQFASRQELITNRGVMSVVTNLYYDKAKNAPKKGAGGKGGGSPRRLADLLNQFDLTYDLYAVEGEALVSFLPKEFKRFR